MPVPKLTKLTTLRTAAVVAGVSISLVVGVMHSPLVRAQSTPGSPAFEVASIKPSKQSGPRRMQLEVLPGGRFRAVGVPLQMLIAAAYEMPFQSKRLTGGPDWIHADGFDIEATAPKDDTPGVVSPEQREGRVRLMLQSLLADRFQLVIRRETREVPVYAVVAGKHGLKLVKSKTGEKDCSSDSGDTRVSCHDLHGGLGRGVHGEAVTIADLAQFVSNWADRPIIDRSGIPGLFKIDTEGWAPAHSQLGRDDDEGRALSDPDRPTLFMVFDRLGLKLESRRAPIEMIVIEHVERPTGN